MLVKGANGVRCLGHYWLKWWLFAYLAINHHLDQRELTVNWTVSNTWQWNFIWFEYLHTRKFIWKSCLQNDTHSVQVPMSLYKSEKCIWKLCLQFESLYLGINELRLMIIPLFPNPLLCPPSRNRGRQSPLMFPQPSSHWDGPHHSKSRGRLRNSQPAHFDQR